ncbi:antibiotic biosynthesis monooxygenase [Pseudomonas sp. PDNC002]|uniref:putative quinol monooxygenase n=1 Tax=Pseudomonas sp. PDNC002 TaxID=2811422 RepID=UPI0019629523|nr:antibiotic biosynthesis monooxygenase family protein [Pseudomonas sp. PDNC002]QRY77686.1 antibiotic biosynthesis monooxygenase [Pseudomonas sp. PDNC002]
MSPSAIAIVRVQAFPGQATALGSYLGELLEQVRRQPGCQSGELRALAADRWQVSTRWASEAELEAHLSGAKAQQWLSQLGCGELALGLEFESRSAD